jgi:hypothetical protein
MPWQLLTPRLRKFNLISGRLSRGAGEPPAYRLSVQWRITSGGGKRDVGVIGSSGIKDRRYVLRNRGLGSAWGACYSGSL